MTVKSILCGLVLFFGSSTILAQWSSDPSENTRVTNGGLLPQIITDGTGGAYIVYQDSPALLRQVWVQWLDKYGFVRFPGDGIQVSSAERYQSPYYHLVSDSVGGVIVLFEDFHLEGDETTGETFVAVYAQRIDSTGAKLWGDAGLEISPRAKRKGAISACSDGANGAFVFWGEDADSSGAFDLRAQRITADGQFAWPDTGVVVTDKFIFDNISNPNPAVSDGLGNAIILYSDSIQTEFDIRLQKLNAEGEFLWGGGVDIFPVGRKMIGDGSGGAVVAGVRREFDGVSVKYVVGAQRVDGGGQVLWGEEGIVITEKADSQTLHVEIAVDREENSLVVWRDRRTGRFEEYAQRLNPDGIPLWEPDGVALSEFDSQKSLLGSGIAPDTVGKTTFVWHDLRIEDGGLFGQRLDSTGSRLWSENDVPISTRAHSQRSHVVISDNAGGAIVCWYETGVGSGFGIFAQQVSRNGNLGEVLITSVSEPDNPPVPTRYILHQSYPNPFNANMIVRYEIPETSHVTLTIYDITGKEVITLVNKNQVPGAYQVTWNGKNKKGGDAASGIYVYQLRAGSFVESKKAILLK